MSNVKVAVRVRPLNKREVDRNAKLIVETNGDDISITNVKVDSPSEFGDSRERVKHFTFDYCYDSTGTPQSPAYSSQQLVFQDLGTEVLQAAFEGYNACILAYGQTSTGKTYTMMGSQEEVGLVPRICEGLFSHVDDFMGENVTFRVDISYLEIYNERVRDLLRPSLIKQNEKYTLKVREHPKEGPYVQDLSNHNVKDNIQIQELLERGNENRTTASTYMHDHSSRSHAIVTISFTQAKLEDDLPHEVVSKIHLVDLAGSERADPTFSANYKGRLKEGANINKSLVTLGNVIKALAERSLLFWSTDNLGSTQSVQSSSAGDNTNSSFSSPKRSRLPYIPYRDSVLTWLLKDSLGGNSKTIMICTITPASIYYNETISTLRYAQRAKSIVNKPKINEDCEPFVLYDSNVTLIRELRREIERLRDMLKSAQLGISQMSDLNIVEMHDMQVETEQGDTVLSLQESGSSLAETLQGHMEMAKHLTQTWKDKWMETHNIIKESDLSIRGLKHRTSSMGVMIESQMPHLVGMDDDILSTGVAIYHLKEGKTLVGREDAQREQDIVLSGIAVNREHCFFKNFMSTVVLHPNRGSQCAVNGIDCRGPTRLKQGDYILLGKTNMFRFNNPAEAAKLRERRKSLIGSEEFLSHASSYDSLDTVDSDSQYSLRSFYSMYGPNLQLERQYQSESERINQAKKELENLREEHQKAEDERREKEEELWRIHEEHQAEIEREKRLVNKMVEETQLQRQKAEADLAYARECILKEKEAFYVQLEEELANLKKQKKKTSLPTQTEAIGILDANIISEEDAKLVREIIARKRKSFEGQIKDLVQGELITTLHHKETEENIRLQSEDLEEQFEQSQQEIHKHLGKIKEKEKGYKAEDASHYEEINQTSSQLEDIEQQEIQLENYIQEKQDFLKVGSLSPQPLRSACSEEVLSKSVLTHQEFPTRTSSLKRLDRGSEGDIPALSDRLSFHSYDHSLDSMLSGSSESMDYSVSSETSTTVGITAKDKKNVASKSQKLTSVAKNVTDRLYKAPPPKFRREARTPPPKTKSAVERDLKKSREVRKDEKSSKTEKKVERTKVDRAERPKVDRAERTKVDRAERTKVDSVKKKQEISKGTSPRESPSRQMSPSPKTLKQAPPSSRPGRTETSNSRAPNKKMSPVSSPEERCDSPNFQSKRSRRLSPNSRSPEQNLNGGRILVPRLRHVTSALSLANVPEAIAEEAEPLEPYNFMQSEPNIPQVVVRRRKKKTSDEDEFRRHSEPSGDTLAEAFDKYTQEVEQGLENKNRELNFVENMSQENLVFLESRDRYKRDHKREMPSIIVTSDVEMDKNKNESDSEALCFGSVPSSYVCDQNSSEIKAENLIANSSDIDNVVREMECAGALETVVSLNVDGTECTFSGAVSDTKPTVNNGSHASVKEVDCGVKNTHSKGMGKSVDDKFGNSESLECFSDRNRNDMELICDSSILRNSVVNLENNLAVDAQCLPGESVDVPRNSSVAHQDAAKVSMESQGDMILVVKEVKIEDIQYTDSNIQAGSTEKDTDYVKAGSKREHESRVSVTVPSKAAKTLDLPSTSDISNENQNTHSTSVSGAHAFVSGDVVTVIPGDFIPQSGTMSIGDTSAIPRETRNQGKRNLDGVEHTGYSSDSLEDGENSVDSLEVEQPQNNSKDSLSDGGSKDSLGEGDVLQDSLDEEDSDMQKSGTLTPLQSSWSMTESFRSSVSMEMQDSYSGSEKELLPHHTQDSETSNSKEVVRVGTEYEDGRFSSGSTKQNKDADEVDWKMNQHRGKEEPGDSHESPDHKSTADNLTRQSDNIAQCSELEYAQLQSLPVSPIETCQSPEVCGDQSQVSQSEARANTEVTLISGDNVTSELASPHHNKCTDASFPADSQSATDDSVHNVPASKHSPDSNFRLDTLSPSMEDVCQTVQDYDRADISTSETKSESETNMENSDVLEENFDKDDNILNVQKVKPSTRTLGVSTSPDLMPPELQNENFEVKVDGQCSDDSLAEAKEQLLELQEALEKEALEGLPPRGPGGNNTQLSSARKAARQRAMINRKQRGSGESDGAEQLSDESLLSGNQSKSSSRPGSASRRRRKVPVKSTEKKTKKTKRNSSEEYNNTTDSDIVYSDNFPSDQEEIVEFGEEKTEDQSGSDIQGIDQSDITLHLDDQDAVNFEDSNVTLLDDQYQSRLTLDGSSDSREFIDSDSYKGKSVVNVLEITAESGFAEFHDLKDGRLDSQLELYSEELQRIDNQEQEWSTQDSPALTGSEQNMENRRVNGYSTSHRLGEISNSLDESDSLNMKHKRPVSLYSTDSYDSTDDQPHSRSASETRDVGQQTDVSSVDSPLISPASSIRSPASSTSTQRRRPTPVLGIGPMSVWCSGDKGVKSPQKAPAAHGLSTPTDKTKRKKKSKSVKLEMMPTEVWSAEIDDSTENSAAVAVDYGSSDDDNSYSMETESITPQTPLSSSDKFIEHGTFVLQDPPAVRSVPLKYEITVKEEETNILYNVDKREYRTYGLQSPPQQNSSIRFPDSININLTDSVTHRTENHQETTRRDWIDFRREDLQSSSPGDIVVAEKNYHCVHDATVSDPGTDRESSVERKFVNEENKNFTEFSNNSKDPLHAEETEEATVKGDSLCSPRESDTTSDYGTMIGEGRRGNVSFYSDSGDELDSVFSNARTVNNDGNEISLEVEPSLEQSVIVQHENTPWSHVGEQIFSNLDEENVERIAANGQELCRTTDPRFTRRVVPASSPVLQSPELISNIVPLIKEDDDEQLSISLTPTPNDNDTDDEVHSTVQEILIPKDVYDSMKAEQAQMSSSSDRTVDPQETSSVGKNEESSEELQTGSDSSIYKTPQQSPRSDQHSGQSPPIAVANKECTEELITKQSAKRPTTRDELLPLSLLSLEKRTTLKTVSVNTDSQEPLKESTKPPHSVDDSSIREDLKRELQQKIARLQRHVRSRSDSAISSDYTDGDSTSVSPRGSRLYDSDKTLRCGGFGNIFVDPCAIDIQVMTTRTEQTPDQWNNQPYLSTSKVLDIENKSAKKSPFKDSGNVCDGEESAEILTEPMEKAPEAIGAETESKALNSETGDNILPTDVDTTESEFSVSSRGSERSLSPGEVVLEDVYENFVSGLESVDRSCATEYVDEIVEPSYAIPQNHIMKEKSPSLSDLKSANQEVMDEVRRSMSENCIDQFEENDTDEMNTTSSNDSIVFVFMGQSHSKESMEQLKSFTSNQPGYKVELASSTELLEDDFNSSNEKHEELDHSGEISQEYRETKSGLVDDASENLVSGESSTDKDMEDSQYDDEPLRHKFGIDEDILPIPSRSMSADNLPSQNVHDLSVRQARSADLSNMGVLNNPQDPSNNEGIFPPCIDSSEVDSQDYSRGSSLDTSTVRDNSMSSSECPFPSQAENGIDDTETHTKEEHNVLHVEEMFYSRIPLKNNESEPPSSQNNHETGVALHFPPHIQYGARGDTPVSQESSVVTSLKSQSVDSSTQTDEQEAPAESQQGATAGTLPSLDSPFRAKSMEGLEAQKRSTDLTLSEETNNWYNLSSMVIENIPFIESIKEDLADSSRDKNRQSRDSHVTQQQKSLSKDDATQTGSSLQNMTSTSVQTDEETLPDGKQFTLTTENKKKRPTRSKRTLGLSETEVTDIIPDEALQESIRLMNVASSERAGSEVPDGRQPDNHHMDPAIEPQVSSSSHSAVYHTERTTDHHETKQTEDKDETVLIEREYVFQSEFEYPDLKVSNAEMEALKKEHEKMMDAIRRASDERKHRTEKLKANMKSPVHLSTEHIDETMEEEVVMETRQVNPLQADAESILSEIERRNRESNAENYNTDLTQEETDMDLPRQGTGELSVDSSNLQSEEIKKEFVNNRREVSVDLEYRRYGMQNNASPTKKEVIDDVMSDNEQIDTPPNSPVPVREECREDVIYKTEKPVPLQTEQILSRLHGLDRKSPAPTRNTPIMPSDSSRVNNRVSTGVEVAVDSSDDFTQTDFRLDQDSMYDDRNNEATTGGQGNDRMREELDRLKRERVHIIDLLSLNYLPASLTVELLEAKLNYCIGQTDLLLQSLEDNWEDSEVVFNTENENHFYYSDVTREYLTKYRKDLQQSKRDIEICRERMDRKQGTGRGRTKGRNRDYLRMKRQADIETFKVERMLEQQNYEMKKRMSTSPLKRGEFSVQDDRWERSSRSTSPASTLTSPRHMTPKQHKDHLVGLRKQVVKYTEEEDFRHRLSRSNSPQVAPHRESLHSVPRSRSAQPTDLSTRYSPRISSLRQHGFNLSYSPSIAFSVPDDLPADVEYGVSTYLVPPGNQQRSYSTEYCRPPSSTLLSPTPYDGRSLYSPELRGRSLSPRASPEGLRASPNFYGNDETRQLLREMEEAREQNLREISRAQRTLNTYDKKSSSVRSPSLDCDRDGVPSMPRRPYSSYSDYASHVLSDTRHSINGTLSGSYELYDCEVSHLTSGMPPRSISPTSSIISADMESLPDSVHSGNFNPLRTRPIRSADIKAKLQRRKLTNRKW